MMKIGCVYTSTNGSLMINVEKEVRERFPDEDIQFFTFSNPRVLAEVVANGGVTANVYREMYNMYMGAVNLGVDMIYNICSSVGDVAAVAQNSFELMGVPLVKIDEAMADYAVSRSTKVGVIATLNTTMVPTKNQILSSAEKAGIEGVEVSPVVVDGAFGKSPEELEEMLLNAAGQIAGEVEVIVLAQASMAACEAVIQKNTGVETVSSPRFGAGALRAVVDGNK